MRKKLQKGKKKLDMPIAVHATFVQGIGLTKEKKNRLSKQQLNDLKT